MPYTITKKGPNSILANKMTGKVYGVHKSRSDAMKQMKAIGMNEHDTRKNMAKVSKVHMTGKYRMM